MKIAFIGCSATGKTTLTKYINEREGWPINPVGSRSIAKEMGFVDSKGEGKPYDVDGADQQAYIGALAWSDDHPAFARSPADPHVVIAARHAKACYRPEIWDNDGNPIATVRPLFQTRLAEAKIAWETACTRCGPNWCYRNPECAPFFHPWFVTDRTPLDDMAYALLHCPEIVTAEFRERAYNHTRTYSLIFFTPLSAGQWLGDDPARQVDPMYHWRHEVLLRGMLDDMGIGVVTLDEGDLERRKDVVSHAIDIIEDRPRE
jgi:hypothetical protein